MIYFTEEQIIILHNDLIKLTGGIKGVKDYNILDFCIKSPFVSFELIDLYPTILEKIAVLGYYIITKHPFNDGNKRIGMHIIMLGLKLNSINVNFKNSDVISLGLGIASNKTTRQKLILFLNSNLVK